MTSKESEAKYGEKMFDRMQKSLKLEGIIVCVKEKGEIDIPLSDLERTYGIITKG